MASFVDAIARAQTTPPPSNGDKGTPADSTTGQPTGDTDAPEGDEAVTSDGDQGDVTEDGDEEQTHGSAETTEDGLDEEALQALADEEKLDLNDASQKSLAERLLRRELKLRAESSTEDDTLTEFEKHVYGRDGEPEDGQQQQQQQERQNGNQPQQQQQPQMSGNWPVINDRGKDWKTWDDAHMAELEELGKIGADAEAGKKPDMRGLNEIRTAQNRRQLIENLPHLNAVMNHIVEQALQRALGPILPQVSELSNRNIRDQAREYAVGDLEKRPEFKGVRALMKPGEGTVTFKAPDTGETMEVDNTPMNRILAANPEILRIHVPHKDPAISMRLTMTAMFKQALKISRGSSPKANAAMLKTAETIARKKQGDRTRQGLNANGAQRRGGSVPSRVINTEPSEFAKLFNPK